MVKHIFPFIASVYVLVLPAAGATAVHTATPTQDNVRYIGAVTCQSSMCHGGASPSRDQFTIWSKDDFHSRAYATLVTARSTRIAESAGITDATTNARCTICHAPIACARDVASTAAPSEGVSCESCHGGASFWLRGHTRTDWTYQDRVHAGMTDMRSVYVRAVTCVKCHQVIEPPLLKAGHPELTFELDGQSASEPRHWTEKEDWFGPKAWLVGQAVALREISRQPEANAQTDEKALEWLLEQVPNIGLSYAGQTGGLTPWSNTIAEKVSIQDWNSTKSSSALTALVATSTSFTDSKIPLPERELRAERLVLGLDRLFKSLHHESGAKGQAELTALFDAVQDRSNFDAQAFAHALQKFADAIK